MDARKVSTGSAHDGGKTDGREPHTWGIHQTGAGRGKDTNKVELKVETITLKGSFTIFLFLVRSHILNSNEVWYWWFCPEGPKNASNSRFLGFYFVPRDLDSQRHMGPRLAAQGTLTSSAGDLDSQRQGTLTSSAKGPRLAAPMMRDLD